MDSGRHARSDRWTHSLILTVTRRCNLRCSYCPTVKDGLPDLTPEDARRAIDLFVERFGGGDLKLFGGEPMLVPDVVEAAIRHAPPSLSVYLSTNGLFLGDRLFGWLEEFPNLTLTVSLDGPTRDHDTFRRGLGEAGQSHAAILSALPRLLRYPRFVVTQTVAPAAANRAGANFRYLRTLGIRRFNLLPGYYLPWKEEQVRGLQESFGEIASEIEQAWERGEYLYLRNLFIRAPTPFYNTGMVVDVDRRIHPSNLILAGSYDDLREQTSVGTLDDPPDRAALQAAATLNSQRIQSRLSPLVRDSTEQVDRLLTALCNRLYPAYFRFRKHRAAA